MELPKTSRIILHIDMNAFFASVEQQSNPFLRGKPIAVTHNREFNGSAILAASYPAKRLGIGLHTRLGEAKSLCPELICVPLDHLKYYSINRQIVKIFREEAPKVEVYSIDEAFLDVSDLCKDLTAAEQLASRISNRIKQEVGIALTSSIGVSHNKLLAKIGSNYKKPDAITVIPWDRRFDFLDRLEIGKIWGIGHHSAPKLRALGITSTRDLRNLDDITLRNLVGSYYTRLRLIANGEHYDPVSTTRTTRPSKSMQHAHTLAKATDDYLELSSLIRKQTERLSRRLRRHYQQAKTVYLGLKPINYQHYGWGSFPKFSGVVELPYPTNHGPDIYAALFSIFEQIYDPSEQIRQVVIGVNELSSSANTLFPIFESHAKMNLDNLTDQINNKFGEFTIRTGDILYQYAKETELSVDREYMTFHPDG